MSIQHVVSIERPAALSVDAGRIKMAFSSPEESHFIAACDIAVLILAHPCIKLSLAVYQILAQNGAVVVTADERYMPCSVSVPLGVNMDGARRPHLQAKYDGTNAAEVWWAQLIESKIRGQALAAEYFDKTLSERLRLISQNIDPGDKSCREAQAAQIYWPAFFASLNSPITFRDKQGAADPVNISLNYAYAVLRAIVARSLASAGLCLNLGVGHCRKDNPFNLVDDFIEPFRFVADRAVWSIFDRCHQKNFDKEVKKKLLASLLGSTVKIAGKEYRLFHSIDFAVNSFCVSLEDIRRKLSLPNQPARPGKTPSSSLWTAMQFPHET